MKALRGFCRAHIRPGDALVLLVFLLPLGLAYPRLGTLTDGGIAAILQEAGQVSGILALAAMVLAALFSARLPVVDRYFGGLPRIWRLHRALGYSAFIMIMVHVLMLAFAQLGTSVDAAMATLFPSPAAYAIWAGWAAWALMVIFLLPTFGLHENTSYQRWKRLHLLSAPALILALAHGLWLAPQATLWWILGALAVAAIGWRKLAAPLVARRDHEGVAVEPLATGVVELSLKPLNGALRYQPGQFIYLTPHDPSLPAGRGEEHPYTVASAPLDDVLRIGIKNLGDASGALQNVTVGSRAQVEGPYGTFFERRFPSCNQLWLAGGIGITPLISGARHLGASSSDEPSNVHAFYLAQNEGRAYYLKEMQDVAARVPAFQVTTHYFRDQGAITAQFLRQHCPDFADREIYMCGPPPMVDHLLRLLRAAGVPRYRIHCEAFHFL